MAPKKKKQDKKYKKATSSLSSNYIHWSSEFDILLVAGYVRFFKWKISNFLHVNSHCILSNYFDLEGFRLRFLLFPKGQESRNNTNKHLSLHLQRAEDNSNKRSCFVGSEITVVNHEDNSNSVRNSIFHRFSSESRSNGQIDQFVDLNSLHDPERGFMLNGTDLHIRGSVIFLLENQISRQLADETGSTSDGVSESSEVTCRGDFQWVLSNYSFFKEAVKINMLKSDPIKIGETCYHLRVGSQTVMAEAGEKYLSVSLEHHLEVDRGQFHREADNTAWFAVRVFVLSWNQQEQVKTREMFGRIVNGRVILGKMSDITSAETVQGFDFLKNYLKIYLKFNVMRERDFLNQHMTNSKNIWNFGEGSKATSAVKRKPADKVFTHFSWEIRDFFWIKAVIRRSIMSSAEIWSKIIRLGQNVFRMKICPFGCELFEHNVGAFLAVFPPAENQLSLLVHYRLIVQNQKGPCENPGKVERIERFNKVGLFHGHPLIPKSIFYNDSAGYIVEGRAKFDAYIHVLDETLDLCDGMMRKRVTWKVDNFLAWEAIRGYNIVPSRYFEHNKCILRFEVGVSRGGILCGTLTSEPSLVEAGAVYQLLVQIAVINHRSPISTYWEELRYYTNEKRISKMGNLSDILREGAGYVVNDKVVFGCEILGCWQGGPDLSSTSSSRGKEDQVQENITDRDLSRFVD